MEPSTPENSTNVPNRLFYVTSSISYWREKEGRTRRYDGVPVIWTAIRDEAPFPSQMPGPPILPATLPPSLLLAEEALGFLDYLDEGEFPDGEHSLHTVPAPPSESDLRGTSVPEPSEILTVRDYAVEMRGEVALHDADEEVWERDDGSLYREMTLEVPVGMARRLKKKRDPAEYIRELEEEVGTVQKFDPEPELPF